MPDKREYMEAESGLALDASNVRYDVTAWRKAQALVTGTISVALASVLVVLNKLTFELADSALIQAPHLVDEYGVTNRLLGDNLFQGAPVVIGPEHHEIHCGDSYVFTHIVDVSGSATHVFLVTVPNVAGTFPDQAHKTFHIVFQGYSESEGEWNLYEAPTVTGAGSAVPVRNRNRESANADLLTVTQGGTVSANGTFLEGMHLGGGSRHWR